MTLEVRKDNRDYGTGFKRLAAEVRKRHKQAAEILKSEYANVKSRDQDVIRFVFGQQEAYKEVLFLITGTMDPVKWDEWLEAA